jgi:hypothetical protein
LAEACCGLVIRRPQKSLLKRLSFLAGADRPPDGRSRCVNTTAIQMGGVSVLR